MNMTSMTRRPHAAEREPLWDRRLRQLSAFRREHGHCNVPLVVCDGLGEWASAQRTAARRPGYPAEHRAALDALGFVWDRMELLTAQREATWWARADELAAFMAAHGHCNVPYSYPGGLAVWVFNQRGLARRTAYPRERRARLQELGYRFDAPAERRSS